MATLAPMLWPMRIGVLMDWVLIKASTSSAMAVYVCVGSCGLSPWLRRSRV